jgi:hypothetical protein
MPCDTQRTPEQTREERRREIDAALRDLEKRLARGAVEVGLSPEGAVVFTGWGAERRRVTDVCAFRTLTQRGSWELRKAVASAELRFGRRVNPQAVASGLHSHDGGQTWSKH